MEQEREHKMNVENVQSFQGQYASGTTYNQGDAVLYNNFGYVSLTNVNTGNEPDISPSNWSLVSSGLYLGNMQPQSIPGNGVVTSVGTMTLPAGTYKLEIYFSDSASSGVVLVLNQGRSTEISSEPIGATAAGNVPYVSLMTTAGKSPLNISFRNPGAITTVGVVAFAYPVIPLAQ
jgi:hypothetical protein